MSTGELLRVTGYIWAVFGGYWRGAASMTKAPHSSEAKWYRWMRWAFLVITFWLIFSDRAAIGFLAERFLPMIGGIAYLGFVLTVSGLVLAIWARKHLAQYWSDMVGVQAEHQLICTGPYAYVRHPIYSGVLLAIAGTVLVLGEWRGVVAFVLQSANWAIKAKNEERLLSHRFGDRFREHSRRTGFLLPRFRTMWGSSL